MRYLMHVARIKSKVASLCSYVMPRISRIQHRGMGIIVPPENLKRHGVQEQSGLTSCLHPITRGDYVDGLIHEAASRYNAIKEHADSVAAEHEIILCGRGSVGRLSLFHTAALTLSYEALHLKLMDAQFGLGVMYWKGVGVRCSLDRAVELYLMAAEQVLLIFINCLPYTKKNGAMV